MNVLLSRRARRDLSEAYEFIAQDDPAAAERFLQHFEEVTATLASGLIEGREVVLAGGRKALSWPLRPYRIYYRRSTEAIQILRVYHQARRPISR